MGRFLIFTHPFYWVSLLVLIINDFLLKSAYPGFITGKLSDFAGLVVLSLLIYTIFPNVFKSIKSKVLLLMGSGLLLALLQLPFFLSLFDAALITLQLPSHNLTPDLSDLIALTILPFVFLFMQNIEIREKQGERMRGFIPVPHLIFGSLSFFALCATSFVGQKEIALNQKISSSMEKAESLFKIHEKFNDNEIETLASHVRGDTLYYVFVQFEEDLWYKRKDELSKSIVNDVEGRLSFIIDPEIDSFRLVELSLSTSGYQIEDTTVTRIYENRFLPILNAL